MVDLNDVAMIPRSGDPVAAVVLTAQPAHVSWVFVDGKVRKRAGKLVGVDLARLQTLAQASHDYLIRTGGVKPQG
jgi:5-methylthioadenosine/S-adenosylhomocysteine deaminase